MQRADNCIDDRDDGNNVCVTRVVTGVVPVVVTPVTTTDSSGNTITTSRTTGVPAGTQATPTGAGGAGATQFDGGAVASAVPMVGAAGMVLAALVLI
jgi:hypothetical protein